MPEIDVACYVRYNTARDVDKNQDEWAAIHIKKIVKNEELNGKFDFRIGGVLVKIDKNNIPRFRAGMSQILAERMMADQPGNFAIVPVPNGNGTIGEAIFAL